MYALVRQSCIRLRVGATALASVLVLQGCVSQELEPHDNLALRLTIHESVPDSWRAAAESLSDADPLMVTPELREFAQSVVKKNSTRRERMLSLVDEIIDDDGLGLKYDPDATFTAAEAFESGLGNCLGFSNLLVAAARELGLNAQYELVSHRMHWNKVEDVLVGTLHVRVVSRVSGRRMTFDFYPVPLESGYSTEPLSDTGALAHYLNNLAVESLHEGDVPRAYALLYKALEARPDIGFIWSNLGLLLGRHDLDEAAEAALNEALSIAPGGLNALANLQRLYYKQGREAEVQNLEQQLERHRQSNPYYHAWLGEQAHDRGDFEVAIAHFSDALDRQENDSEFWALLSRSYESLGMSDAAARALEKSEDLAKPRTESRRSRPSQPEIGSRITRN